jgi:tol-pal system protein YbgF
MSLSVVRSKFVTVPASRVAVTVAFSVAILLGNSSAYAGLFEDDEARLAIIDLRKNAQQTQAQLLRRIEALEAALADEVNQNGQLRRSLLQMESQNSQTQSDIARQLGTIEQMQRTLSELVRGQKDAKDLGQTLDPKLQNFEQRLARLEPIRVVVDGLEVWVDQDEKRAFDSAFAAFRAVDYLGAQQQFSSFLSAYPKSPFINSAQFWLASAQYASRAYREATLNYRGVIVRAPAHPKAAEAQLGIANSYLELKDTKAAKKAYEDLLRAYPQSEAAASADARLKSLK